MMKPSPLSPSKVSKLSKDLINHCQNIDVSNKNNPENYIGPLSGRIVFRIILVAMLCAVLKTFQISPLHYLDS